jgi:hypothetical protein
MLLFQFCRSNPNSIFSSGLVPGRNGEMQNKPKEEIAYALLSIMQIHTKHKTIEILKENQKKCQTKSKRFY